jgi:hypothetical protein
MAFVMSAGAWLAFLWLRTFLPRVQAFLAVLAFAASMQFVVLSTSVMSEAPTVFFLYLGLVAFFKDLRNGHRGAAGWIALLSWMVLFRMRINTSPFFVMYMILLLLRRDFRKAAVGAALAGTWIALEHYWARHLVEPGGYVRYGIGLDYRFADHPLLSSLQIARNYLKHLYSYVGSVFGSEMLPWFYYTYPMDRAKRLVVLGLSAWCLCGFAVFWRREPRYRPVMIAFLLMWAPIFIYWRTLFRYMMPSLPFLIAAMCVALDALVVRVRPLAGRFEAGKIASWAVAGFLVVVVVNQAFFSSQFKTRWDYWSEERISYRNVHAFIRNAIPRPDMVVAIHNYQAYRESGVPSVDWDFQWEYLRSHGMAEGKRVWGFFVVPGPGAERKVDLGEGWCLGEKPLLQEDLYHSLYEMIPCAKP